MDMHPLVLEWSGTKSSPGTRRSYQLTATEWVSWLPVSLLDAERCHGEAWRDQLIASGQGERTVTRKLSTVSSLYTWLAGEGHVARSPMARVRRPAVERHWGMTPAVETEPIRLILAQAKQSSPRLHVAIALMLTGAVRVNDLAHIQASDLVRMGDTLALHLGAGGSVETVVPVPAHCLGSVSLLLESHPSCRLLCEDDGSEWSYWQILRAIRSASKAAGVAEDLTPQVLRATWATLAIESAAMEMLRE